MLRVVNAGADGTWKLRGRYDAERTTLSRRCRFDPGPREFCEGEDENGLFISNDECWARSTIGSNFSSDTTDGSSSTSFKT